MQQSLIAVILMMGVLTGCANPKTEPVNNTSSNVTSNEKASNPMQENQNKVEDTKKEEVPNQQQSIHNTTDNELANAVYDGKNHVITINQNKATFSKEELSLDKGNWQTFSDLDQLNRVGVANAMLHKSMMPTEKRERLYVSPTGWKNKKVTVNGKTEWLYNRSHLIGYQFTGENNNLKNLMTGTRKMNDPDMVLYENKVASYLKKTGNHVRYQVTPIFKENELVARGVHMMAKSVEDNGIEFNIYIFNVQPGVEINYMDGTSKLK